MQGIINKAVAEDSRKQIRRPQSAKGIINKAVTERKGITDKAVTERKGITDKAVTECKGITDKAATGGNRIRFMRREPWLLAF